MAVQAQFGGGWFPFGGGEEQMFPLWGDYDGALLSAAAGKGGYPCSAAGVASAAQSELTCNNGGGVGAALPSRKRGRDADQLDRYVVSPPSSSAALLPIPSFVAQQPAAVACRMVGSGAASTSGRAAIDAFAVADALMVAELCALQGGAAEVDALVHAECERLRAGLEQASKRQRQELVGAVAAIAARTLREKEAELIAARRRAAELEERLRQAAAESQAWLGVARSNEAVAAGLRATLDHVLLGGLSGGVGVAAPIEGCGESNPAAAAADDAQSCCFGDTGASPADSKWACKACGEREATVLLLPCRHLCLCKSCEPRTDACPVCLATKNASIHVAPN